MHFPCQQYHCTDNRSLKFETARKKYDDDGNDDGDDINYENNNNNDDDSINNNNATVSNKNGDTDDGNGIYKIQCYCTKKSDNVGL